MSLNTVYYYWCLRLCFLSLTLLWLIHSVSLSFIRIEKIHAGAFTTAVHWCFKLNHFTPGSKLTLLLPVRESKTLQLKTRTKVHLLRSQKTTAIVEICLDWESFIRIFFSFFKSPSVINNVIMSIVTIVLLESFIEIKQELIPWISKHHSCDAF